MLRPSRPMMRPFRSSLGRSTTETVVSIACSAAQRWIASVMFCFARPAAVSRASASSRFTRLAASCRASPSICFRSSSRRLVGASGRRPAAARAAGRRQAARSCVAAAAALLFVHRRGLRRARAAPARAVRSIASRSASAASRRPAPARGRASPAGGPRAWRSASAASSCAFSFASSSGFLLQVFGIAVGLLRSARACFLARVSDGLGGDAASLCRSPDDDAAPR